MTIRHHERFALVDVEVAKECMVKITKCEMTIDATLATLAAMITFVLDINDFTKSQARQEIFDLASFMVYVLDVAKDTNAAKKSNAQF